MFINRNKIKVIVQCCVTRFPAQRRSKGLKARNSTAQGRASLRAPPRVHSPKRRSPERAAQVQAFFWLCLLIASVLRFSASTVIAAEPASTNEYAAVDAIFSRRCLDCHAAQDPEGDFVLESFDTLMKGGKLGQAVVPGKGEESLLTQMIEGKFERDGKKKIMPPGKRNKLDPAEIAAIKAWIDAGAHGPPAGTVAETRKLVVPTIIPKVAPRMPVTAIAYEPALQMIAVATYGEVELRSFNTNTPVRVLTGHQGNVNAVVFSPDGACLFAAVTSRACPAKCGSGGSATVRSSRSFKATRTHSIPPRSRRTAKLWPPEVTTKK